MRKVDVAIIGAGSAGLSARREVAKQTKNYVVIDNGILGTTCARVGCMPSKVLIQVAEDFERRKKFKEQGIHGGENLEINTKEVMGHVRKLRDRFVRSVMGGMNDWMDDEHFIKQKAKFEDNHTLVVGEDKVRAEKIIIATGSHPKIPSMLKDYKEFLIDTDSFFELEDLPKSVAVVGLGVIGIELGQALHRLGVEVIGINRRKNISGITDPKLAEYITDKFSSLMNITYAGVDKVTGSGNKLVLTSAGQDYEVEKVLVTTGRAPNVANLGLENTSIECNEKGLPKFHPQTFQTRGAEHIFIVGDTNGRRPILHEASDEGRIAGFNSVNSIQKFKTRTPMAITFSDPNIAYAGKMYHELLDDGELFEVGEVSFEGQGRSIVKLKEMGLLRVYGQKNSGLILGAELFAPDGEHLAHLLAWIIDQGLTVNEVLALPFYHPVTEEGLRTALRDLRDKLDIDSPLLEIFPLE